MKKTPDADFDPKTVLSRALVPAVVRVNEQQVRTGFWPKIRRLGAKAPFAGDALAVWFCARDPKTPARAKAMTLAALAYFVVPTDAIPDFIAGLGFVDDAAVFATLVTLLGRHLKPEHRAAGKAAVERIRDER